jgi:hypothetical protein
MIASSKRFVVFALAVSMLAACGSSSDSQTNGADSEARTKNAATNEPFDTKPETAAASGVPDIVLVGLGDSYGSGEGDPAVPTGDPDSTRWWGLTNHTSEGAELCHRSSKAAFVQAAMELQRQYPARNIYWKHFACTGAQTEHLSDETYDATLDQNGALIMDSATDVRQENRPQFEDALAWVNSLPWGNKPKRIDAIYISIGGNDVGGWEEQDPVKRKLGLGEIIKQCIEPGFEDCDEGDKRTYIENAARYAAPSAGLQAAYTRLNTSLDNRARLAGVTVGKKLLNAYPNLLQSDVVDPATNENAFCGDEGEGTPFDPVGRMNSGLLANSDSGDWTFVGETILANVRDTQIAATAALGWDLVRYDSAANEAAGFGTFEAWTPHGICATTNWVHDMAGAAALQGDDMNIAFGGLLATSFGAVHPNPAGWRDFAKRAFFHLNKIVAPATTPTTNPVQSTIASSTTVGTDDSSVSPRPVLPVEAAPDSVAPVPVALASDAAGILDVSAAAWVATGGPRQLVWTLSYRGRQIPCTNCAFLTASVKGIIAAVLDDPVGDGVRSVFGFDPGALEGDYISNGWAAEFVVGTDANSPVFGDAIQRWVLECVGDDCRSQSLKIAEMRWGNGLWSVVNCATPLWRGGPTSLSGTSVIDGATEAEIRDAALDRVRLAAPHYRPIVVTDEGSGSISGYVSTGCAS